MTSLRGHCVRRETIVSVGNKTSKRQATGFQVTKKSVAFKVFCNLDCHINSHAGNLSVVFSRLFCCARMCTHARTQIRYKMESF